jgi:guanine deaminase
MDKRLSFLKQSVKIAIEGIELGSGPFGAIIVKNGIVISSATNRVVASHDPTAHAEVVAIRMASEKLGTHDLSGCDLYCSCEPCPMCLGAIYWSGIINVYYSTGRESAAKAGFNDSFIYDELGADPTERRVKLTRLEEAGGEEVFDKWNLFDGRHPY